MNSLSFKLWVNEQPTLALKYLFARTQVAVENLLAVTIAKVNNQPIPDKPSGDYAS